MTAQKTVLILGSGASAHLGYPVGPQLLDLIAPHQGAPVPDVPGDWPRGKVQEFQVRLARAGYWSVDAFLEMEPEYVDIGRYLITRELKRFESEARFFPGTRSGWYRHLLNAIAPPRQEHLSDNLSIVTFNYDRSVEAYLHLALAARFNCDKAAALELSRRIEIVHLHGVIGEYPEVPYQHTERAGDLLAAARKIKVISELREAPDGFCSPEFKRANELLHAANRIFFVGFGFHQANIARLKFFDRGTCVGRTIHANWNPMHQNQEALYRLIEDMGLEPTRFLLAGTPEQFFTRHFQL